jgi:SAM-dependent methyltransferase
MTLDFSRYDTRHYPTVSVREGYAAWSRFYDGQMDGNLDLYLLERIAGIDWSTARSAVDLACGTGRIGAWLATRGIEAVDGIDLTPEMLALATRRGVYRTLLHEDMSATSLPAGTADVVASCLAIGHVPELGPAYREADRLLRSGGGFVLIGYHPYFLLAGVPTHFHDENDEPVAIRNHIHLVSDHVRAGRAQHWHLTDMLERVVDQDWVSRAPRWERHLHKPASFALAWRKPDDAGDATPREGKGQ